MEEWVKNRGKGFWSIVSILLVMIVVVTFVFPHYLPVVIEKKSDNFYAEAVTGYQGDEMFVGSEADNAKFRSNAKFKILEIVPYHGMAEIGYGIKGEEPIDIRYVNKTDWKNDLHQITGAADPNIYSEKDVLGWDTILDHLVNNSLFVRDTLKYALELSDEEAESYVENQSVDVLVVEADTINKNLKLIDQADYIYVHNDFCGGAENTQGAKRLALYQKYSKEGKKGTVKYGKNDRPRFACNGVADLSEDVVKKLYKYAFVKKMPITFSGYAVKNEASDKSRYQSMGYSIAIGQFYESMLSWPESAKILGKYPYKWYGMKAEEVYRKLFEESSSSAREGWAIKDFVAYLSKDKVDNCPEANAMPGYSGEKHQIYDNIVNMYLSGSPPAYSEVVNEGFVGSYKTTTVCTLAHGAGDNSSISRKLHNSNSQGDDKFDLSDPLKQYCKGIKTDTRIIAIAINNSLKPILKVLDVEPDNEFTLEDSDVREWLSEDVTVGLSIEQKTMSEFIGLNDDLNSEYDLIYFGKNMNHLKVDRLYATGVAGGSTSLADLQVGKISGDNFEYSGNDITDRMAKRVKDFIDAGYPVVYEDALNNEGTIDKTTKMYQFINEMASEKASNMYKAEDKKISGTIKDAQIETKKPKIIETAGVVKEYKETGASIVSNLKFKVGLKYGVGDYRIFVYVDTDHNGIFNRWENISGVYKLDNNYELSLNDVDITAGTTKEIYASIPEKAKLGVVSWKLEVVKLEDGKLTGIRTCITGNSKVDTYEEVKRADGSTDRQPRTVNVLQLSDLSNATTPNLSKDITEGEKNFSNLLKSSIVSDSFRVKVTSRDIYTTDFSELPLLDYDVVIVGFVDENKKLSDENGLLNKLAIAAGRGKGIIFTQDALSYFNAPSDAGHWGTKTNERIRNMLGMDRYDVSADPIANKMAFTYNLLSLFSASKYFDKYITISGTPGIENLPSADYVERINSAKIARYPYIINVRSDGFDSISGIYQTDVEENIINGKDIQQGVGYFCLSNEKVSSPTSEQEAYSISPKDIRNNYYLWRNDTVFYSGITRNAFADAGKMNELKLFVNTIISAYGLDRYVQINVKNLPSSSDYAEGKAYYLYVDMDYDSKTFEGEKNIDFDITTKNIAPTNLKMSFYRADRDGKKVVEDGSAKKLHVKMNGNIIKVGDESSGNTSVSVSEKTDYTFNYPLSFLSDADNPNIVMEVVKDLGGTEIKDTVLIRVMRRSMFELD